jgi:hypothetical protein
MTKSITIKDRFIEAMQIAGWKIFKNTDKNLVLTMNNITQVNSKIILSISNMEDEILNFTGIWILVIRNQNIYPTFLIDELPFKITNDNFQYVINTLQPNNY